MPPTDLTWQTVPLTEGFYTSEVQALDRRPIRTFLPTGYERNYAYPLLVFLHGQGGDEEQVLRLAPRLSRRNYICIGLRGPECVGPRQDGRLGYGWGQDGPCDSPIEEYVLRAVEQTRRQYHIHSERVFLAGFCEGATTAYRLGLANPDRYAGVISLNGTMPRSGCPLIRLNELRQLRVFIGHGLANAIIPHAMARRDYSLLFTAGLSVEMHTYPTTHRVHTDMLRDVNRWMMRHVNQDV